MNSVVSPMIFTLGLLILPELKNLVWRDGQTSLSLDFSGRHKNSEAAADNHKVYCATES